MTCRDCTKYETCQSPPPGGAYGAAEGLSCFEQKGGWIKNDIEIALELTCPVCGFMYTEADPKTEDVYKYCPECGAKNK